MPADETYDARVKRLSKLLEQVRRPNQRLCRPALTAHVWQSIKHGKTRNAQKALKTIGKLAGGPSVRLQRGALLYSLTF
jgi:hypothetical protein